MWKYGKTETTGNRITGTRRPSTLWVLQFLEQATLAETDLDLFFHTLTFLDSI
jgi:hypothetical protein